MIRAALAEAAWLRGDAPGVLAQVAAARETPWAGQFGRPSGELALWTFRCGKLVDPPARGATNPEIALALHLSERTVAHHVSAILSKLDVRTRTAAVEAAHAAGVLLKDGRAGRPIQAT